MIRKKLLGLAMVMALAGSVRADVKPHILFSDGAVLQQGAKVPVWGTADDGEKVTVELQGQTVSTVAKDGKWKVELANLKPGGPFELVINGKNSVKVPNILVGEVWVASGQSNMEWSVSASADVEKVKAGAKLPQVRFFKVPHVTSDTPLDTVAAKWGEVTPESVGGLSAVAYHFAKDIHQTQKVPVGVLQTAWGGTICEAWASRPGLTANETIKKQILDPYDAAVKDGKKVGGPNRPTVLYNGMIAPLVPYAIKGAIWYQGESNAGRAYQYRTLFPLMIEDWRKVWGQGDFPFLFVQLAPYMKIEEEPKESQWAELREAQLFTSLKTKNTAQAVITDVGDEKDIHPKQKEPVGLRLALAGRALAYGEKVVYSGPVYDSMKVDGNKAVLSFKHVGAGLVGKGGPLQGFTIAGEDKKFVKADAQLLDDKIVVSSPQVAKPVAVRYGWANCPVVNLWNKDGLPASPFRTDDFPGLTAPKTSTGGQ